MKLKLFSVARVKTGKGSKIGGVDIGKGLNPTSIFSSKSTTSNRYLILDVLWPGQLDV